MKIETLSTICAVALLSSVTAVPARADGDRGDRDDQQRLSVTVAFGAGLNTSGAANHHVRPQTIRLSPDGVVNFVVAGSHQIFVYNPGTGPGDIAVPASGTFIDDLNNIYYQGLSPVGPPPPGFSNVQNRVESVSFSDPGTYLVICNLRGHFLNGMFAFVVVGEERGEHEHGR